MRVTCVSKLTFATLAPALCVVALAVSPAHADTVLLADGQTLIGELLPGRAPGELRLKPPKESEQRFKRDDVLAIDFGRPPEEGTPITVTLHTGDRLAGAVSFGTGASLTVRRAAGALTVPLTAVATVRLKPGTPLPGAGASDVVVLANRDRLEGKVEATTPTQIIIRSSLGRTPVDLKRIVGLVMARRDVTPAGEGLRVALDLAAGERLSGHWLSFDEDAIDLDVVGLGRQRVPLSSVARLVVQNGRVIFLSDLRPVEARQVPYLDTEHPLRVNLSQGGHVLQLGGTKYSHGLGVHSRSDLTYEVGGKFKQFATTLGVDDEVGSAGSVVFRIWGDEKLLLETPVMRGSDAPKTVQVDVSTVLLLRLEVDYGDDSDLADHADWANARLLR
jgi:NPCBM/NEW2 domain